MSDATTLKAYELSDHQAAGVGMSAEEMESHFVRRMKETGSTRRALFGVLAMDARQLASNIQREGDEATEHTLELLERVNDERNWLESHINLMEIAQARVLWALSQVIDGEESEQ